MSNIKIKIYYVKMYLKYLYMFNNAYTYFLTP